jgi:hypothetical protein
MECKIRPQRKSSPCRTVRRKHSHEKMLNVVLEGFNESQSSAEAFRFHPEEAKYEDCVQTTQDTAVTPRAAASFAEPEDKTDPLDSQDPTSPWGGKEEKDAFVRRPLRRGSSRNGSTAHRSMSIGSLISMPSLSSMMADDSLEGGSSQWTIDSSSSSTLGSSGAMLSYLNIHPQSQPDHAGKFLECLETSIITKQEPEKEQRRWESVPEDKDSSPTKTERKNVLDIACSAPASVPKDPMPSVARRTSGDKMFPGKEDSSPSEAPRTTKSSTPPSMPRGTRPPLVRKSGSLSTANAKDSAPIMATRRTSRNRIFLPEEGLLSDSFEL